MERSYLIQRLRKPAKRNPFAFGGGLRNGGLSDETMTILQDIFSFDYMGAAEFEFGAVPDALQEIAKNVDNYIAYSFSYPLSKVKKSWRDTSTKWPIGRATIYVISRENQYLEVTSRIQQFAAGNTKANNLKEPTLLSRSLRPCDAWDADIKGWLELDNAFFFFTDEEMWEKTKDLFGIE